MKVIGALFLIINIVTAKENQHRTTEIDLVLEGLRDQGWSQEEQPCLAQTLFTLNNAKNYTVWAMSIWNSMQHPVGSFYGAPYSLGHYDQCLHAPTKAADVITQYCLADVKLTSREHKWEDRNVMGDTEAFLGTRTDMNRDLSKITWGVCLPAVCKPGSAAKILKTIYMVNPLMSAEPSIEIENCQVSGAKTEFSTGFYAFFSVVLALVTTAIFSTIYVQIANPMLKTAHISRCFCLKGNWLSLTKESTSDDISSISFLKVLLAIVAVLLHSWYFRMQGPIGNVLYFEWLLFVKETDRNAKNIITKTFGLGIDVFFVMAGILLIRGLMRTKRHPLVSLANRYFSEANTITLGNTQLEFVPSAIVCQAIEVLLKQLTVKNSFDGSKDFQIICVKLIGSFALVTFYVAAVSIHTGDGPLWNKLAGREQKAASDSWLWSVLMLNNFINSKKITPIVAWHTPCDYQLAIMATIIFMLWQKDYRLGKMVTILVSVLAMLIPAVVTYWMKLPGTWIVNDVEQLTDLRKNEVFLEMYIKSYHKAIPYLMGMGMGYIMAVYKPEKHRKSIPLELSLFLGVVTGILLARTTTGTVCCKNDRFGTAVFVPYQKLMFALGTCLVIGLDEYGSLTFLRRVTKLHCFTVLSRLTYGIYLTHSLFLQQNAFSAKYIQETELFTEFTFALGVFCLSVSVSVLLWLFVEAPLNNLVKLAKDPKYSRITERKQEQDLNKPEAAAFGHMLRSETSYIDKIKEM